MPSWSAAVVLPSPHRPRKRCWLDALDLLADGASDEAVDVEDEPPEGPREPESELRARQNPISIAHVARTPESDTVSDANPQAPDQGKEGGGR